MPPVVIADAKKRVSPCHHTVMLRRMWFNKGPENSHGICGCMVIPLIFTRERYLLENHNPVNIRKPDRTDSCWQNQSPH